MKKFCSPILWIQKLLLVFLLFGNIQNASSQETPKTQIENYPMVSITNTESRTLHSAIMNQEMEIYIKLPSSYYRNPEKKYQALYLTDGNQIFPMAANMIKLFELSQSTETEIIIIGIGYKINDMADWAAWRTRDFTPSNVPSVDSTINYLLSGMTGRKFEIMSGGADKFLEFIEKEVIPFVESDYRVSAANRGIGGYSYGGLFSLYVLFKQPELFNIYYAGSPSLYFDDRILFNFEKEYASSHKDMNARLFMSIGGSEDSLMISNMESMTKLLNSRFYTGLTVESHVFPDETHESCIPSSIMRALGVLYNKR